ncbi:hypothetical protein QWZ08_25625 [Ferruginibacter paludis]|uniref:hypothetical protein n=1 Tax=Ferruginibacter paludis TaxID=1310417 RepID=UPI0025B550BF|nr:hypothetical protein [Ferruginibacter paludis]MDN3659050.1 hypothetical protein [Ferruginibacter paludis]
MKEQQFSTEESLQLIGEMIGKAKRSYVSKGIASIVWGVLIIFCSIVTWGQIEFKIDIGFDIWLLLLLALLPQVYFAVKEKRGKKFIGHDEETMHYVWISFTVCIFITSFYNSRWGGESSTTLIMMLYGIPTFITGGIFKFKPMIIGGMTCWVISIFSIYTPFKTDMLLMAACGLFAWLIPGIILWKRYKKQQQVHV